MALCNEYILDTNSGIERGMGTSFKNISMTCY